jgi:saccharopepsin
MGNPYIKLLSLVDPDQASAEFHDERGGSPMTNITYNTANSTATPTNTTSVTLTSDIVQTLDMIGKIIPAMLGILALNALILVILVVVGIIYLCRGRKKKVRAVGRRSPIPMNRSSNSSLRVQPHVYEPVSMALTEDTVFTPPSPGFHKLGGERPKSSAYRGSFVPEDTPFTPPSPVQPNGRPKSAAHQSIMISPSDDDVLIPPSPSYHSFDGPQRAGSRPPSTISQQVGIALTDDASVTASPRAIQSFDNTSLRTNSRPQSAASQRLGVTLTDGPVAVTPRLVSPSSEANHQLDDRPRSAVSQQVGVALTDDTVLVPPRRILHAFEDRDFRPGDRPNSVAYQSVTRPPQEMLAPPSPGFHLSDRPRSIA